MNISILNFKNSPFCFQPRFLKIVFPVEALDFLLKGDNFFNDHFFRFYDATSGSASETYHVQGLASDSKVLAAMWPKGSNQSSKGLLPEIDVTQ